jgi:uncharacterized protein YqeY
MSLQETLETDLKTSFKNADAISVGILRMIIASLQNEAIAKRGKGDKNPLTDEEVITILKKEAKKSS